MTYHLQGSIQRQICNITIEPWPRRKHLLETSGNEPQWLLTWCRRLITWQWYELLSVQLSPQDKCPSGKETQYNDFLYESARFCYVGNLNPWIINNLETTHFKCFSLVDHGYRCYYNLLPPITAYMSKFSSTINALTCKCIFIYNRTNLDFAQIDNLLNCDYI